MTEVEPSAVHAASKVTTLIMLIAVAKWSFDGTENPIT
jgi:hypothetical protein